MTIKVGDVVKTKASDGPKMTVDAVTVGRAGNTGERVTCVWFDAGLVLHGEQFSVDALSVLSQQ